MSWWGSAPGEIKNANKTKKDEQGEYVFIWVCLRTHRRTGSTAAPWRSGLTGLEPWRRQHDHGTVRQRDQAAEYPATGGNTQPLNTQPLVGRSSGGSTKTKSSACPNCCGGAMANGKLTMYELYSMWLRYPIFRHEQAVMTRNSKQLRHNEEGIWGLNKPRRESPGRERQRRG